MSSPPPSNPGYQRPSFDVARHSARGDAGRSDQARSDPARSSPVEDERHGEAPVPPEIRQSARVLQISLAVIVVIALATVGVVGGFERAGVHQGVLVVPVDQEFNAGVWQVTIEGAIAGTDLRRTTPDEGNYLIEIDTTIKNIGDRTEAIHKMMDLRGIDGLVEPDPIRMFHLRDDRLAFYLQPGLSERVAFLWEVKGGTPVPRTLDLLVNGIYPRPTNVRIFNELVDFDEPAATVSVPVVDRTEST